MIMEKYWKAFSLISATYAVGISIGLVGPFMYHEINKFDIPRSGILSCLFASRGIGSLIGTVVSTFLLTKSNQSFWLCTSLLMLASSIVLLPWSLNLAVLALAITIQGLATATTKSCTQNLMRFYHGFSPIGSSVLKLMHVSFAFGCFLALVCVIMFTDISSHKYSFLTTIKDNSNNSVFSTKIIVKRSIVENVNSSDSVVISYENETVLEFENHTNLNLSINSTVPINSTTTSLEVLTTSSSNETDIDFDLSNTTNTTFELNATDISSNLLNTTNATLASSTQNFTTPIPTKPAVVDSNNANHHKDAADGKIIKEELKKELNKNPLDGKPPEASAQTNTTTTASVSRSNLLPPRSNTTNNVLFNQTTMPMKSNMTTTYYLNEDLIEDLDNLTEHEGNVTSNTTKGDSLHLTTLSNVPNLINSPSSSTIMKSTVTTTTTTTVIPSTFETTVPLSTTTSFTTTDSFMTVNVVTKHNEGISNLTNSSQSSTIVNTTSTTTTTGHNESPMNTTVANSNNENHHKDAADKKINSTSTPTFRNTTAISSIDQKAVHPTLSSMTSLEPKHNTAPKLTITQLEALYSLIHSMSWDSHSATNGFYLLSVFVFLISGIIAINSGLCGKSKSCRSYSEVNYTCSEKDSLTFSSSMYARLSLVAFHWSYNSFELLVGGLLASYFTCIGGLPLYIGVAATCLFWFGFFWGRLLFFLLSPLARLFRMTFLAIFLTLACLVAFLCVLHATSSLPWYFFACMISLKAFFFALISPSFQGYRENFPLLSYNPPLQDVLCSCGEVIIPPIACFFIFAGSDCHLISILVALMVTCLLSVYSFKFFASAVPKKSKALRRKTSFTSVNCGENGEEADVNTSSFEVGSTTKPLLP